ncbi:MAG: recombinase family protein [Armatimonadota bacterium]
MKSQPSKRCCIYIRVSTEEQANRGVSLDVQEKVCRDAAKQLGYEVVGVFCDAGKSAFKGKPRPAYDDMFRQAKARRFDVVIVWKQDRFGRNTVEALNGIKDLISYKIGFYSATEPVFDLRTAAGWMQFSLACVLAEYSSRQTQERVVAAMEEVYQRGRTTGKPPYGYVLTVPKSVIQVDPEKAAVVRDVFNWYAYGVTLMSICRKLQAAGVPTPRQSVYWSTSAVRSIIGCRTYLGKVAHKRLGIEYQGLHDAIITEQLWAKCQARMKMNRVVAPRARGTSLSPLLFCGYCGAKMHKCQNGSHMKRYHCSDRSYMDHDTRHPACSIGASILERYVWELVRIGTNEEAETEYRLMMSGAFQVDDGLAGQLRDEQQQLEKKIMANVTAVNEGLLPARLLREQNLPLMQKLEDVIRRIEEAVLEHPGVSTSGGFIGNLEAVMNEDYTKQLDVLSRMFQRIEVFKDKLIFQSRDGSRLEIVKQYFGGRASKTPIKIQVISFTRAG